MELGVLPSFGEWDEDDDGFGGEDDEDDMDMDIGDLEVLIVKKWKGVCLVVLTRLLNFTFVPCYTRTRRTSPTFSSRK